MKSFLSLLIFCLAIPVWAQTSSTTSDEKKIALTFTGGYDTVGQDRGRPVILIASALGVTPEVFRDAFSKVHPAPAGQQPEPGQVSKNKEALMEALSPYGITNDRLDTVSNYYRYNRSRGEMWRNTPAEAYAIVRHGVVTSIIITNAGSGYTSAPKVTVLGQPEINLTTTLAFGTDFDKNGSIKAINPTPAP